MPVIDSFGFETDLRSHTQGQERHSYIYIFIYVYIYINIFVYLFIYLFIYYTYIARHRLVRLRD